MSEESVKVRKEKPCGFIHARKIRKGEELAELGRRQGEVRAAETGPGFCPAGARRSIAFVPCRDPGEAVRERLAEGSVLQALYRARRWRKIRKDAPVAIEYAVSASSAFFEGEDRVRLDYFRAAFEFIARLHGPQNVLQAAVVLGDGLPSMQVAVFPVILEGSEAGKLQAGYFLTRDRLMRLQSDFARDVGRAFGLKRSPSGAREADPSPASGPAGAAARAEAQLPRRHAERPGRAPAAAQRAGGDAERAKCPGRPQKSSAALQEGENALSGRDAREEAFEVPVMCRLEKLPPAALAADGLPALPELSEGEVRIVPKGGALADQHQAIRLKFPPEFLEELKIRISGDDQKF